MSNSPYSNLRQNLGNPNSARTRRREAHLSGEPVQPDTTFSVEERTVTDPLTGELITLESGTHYLLACGCRVFDLSSVQGICSGCAKSNWRGRWRKPKLVCKKHTLCVRCRRARLRELAGGGILKRAAKLALKLVLWPFFDVRNR